MVGSATLPIRAERALKTEAALNPMVPLQKSTAQIEQSVNKTMLVVPSANLAFMEEFQEERDNLKFITNYVRDRKNMWEK